MMNVSVARWKTLSAHFDQALELAPPQRGVWLAHLARKDAPLAAELRGLLAELAAADHEAFPDTRPVDDTRPVEYECAPPAAARPAASPVRAGARLGPYTLEAPMGQPGPGGIWLAHRGDGPAEPTVVIRLLNGVLPGKAGHERFLREGMMLARLAHQHIAHLIDAGVSGAGVPYLVLEHVDGQRIDHFCDARQLSLRARVTLFLDLLDAVAHAHHHLIVHRDLKPSNVLVTRDGRVKLLGLGVARLSGQVAPGVDAAAAPGAAPAPVFAAPEQLRGGPVSNQTDIHALGALLYLLLTGQHPTGLARAGAAQFVRAITGAEPMRASLAVTLPRAGKGGSQPQSLDAARRATTVAAWPALLRGDLDNILAKALRRAPARRYATVQAFAQDLRRYLDHKPVRARPDTWALRLAHLAQAHGKVAAGVAAVAAAAWGWPF